MGFSEPPATTLYAQAVRAWQAIQGPLRQTLARADYETWVRDVAVGAYDGQVLTLTVANPYARDWLAEHLRATVERLLRPHLGAAVQVVFRVAAAPPGPHSGTTVPQTAPPPEPGVDLTLLHQRLRAALQQSHRVVYLPGYFLRWVPLLGTRAAWLYVALRQAHFLADPQPHGPETRIAGQGVEVTRATLARWAHLTPRTINNLLNQNRLAPLVQVQRDRHREAHRQAPNRYVFTADMPLTPQDHQRVLAFLHRHGWPENPVGALARALETAPHGLIPTPQHFTPEGKAALGPTPSPSLRQTLTAQLPPDVPPETHRQILGMIELLESTLVETWGKLFISWYFIQRHLPRLGHTFAWLYLTARHLAERLGRPTGHGFRLLETTSAAVAAWVGLSKARYVRDLIPAAPLESPADLPHAPPGAFLRRLPGRGVSLTLAVQIQEPLAPEDQQTYGLALQGLSACIQRRDLAPLVGLGQALAAGRPEQAVRILQSLLPSPASEPPESQQPSQEALLRAAEALAQIAPEASKTSGFPQKGHNFPPEKPPLSLGADPPFPRSGPNLPSASSQLSPGEANSFSHFNLKTPSSPHLQPLLKPPAFQPTPPRATAPRQAGWSWEHLLHSPHINPKVVPRLQQHPPERFVAWLLYAYAQGKAKVTHPLGLAIHHTLRGHSPEEAYEGLAQLPPSTLLDLLQRHLNYGFAAARAKEPRWAAMAYAAHEHLEQLFRILAPEAP